MITLSICMMVKDEEKNLDRCLTSLQKLRNQISSELIIVDTGSIDNTVQIAQKYTEKVYYHQWNHHFADMRNTTISYAQGKWIFIIDADEELREDEGLISFFENTTQWDKFYTGTIASRDFTKLSSDENYFEYISPRIFKNDGSFKYEGRVHNQPIYKEPITLIQNTLLLHYGYNSEDQELMNKKFERTSTLLEQELKKNPEDIYYRYQLSVVYRMHKHFEKAFDEIEKAYYLVKDRSDQELYTYVIKQYIISLKDLNKEKEVLKISEDFLAEVKKDVDMSFFYADTLKKFKEFEKAKQYFENYFLLVNQYEKNTLTLGLSDKIQTISLKEVAQISIMEIYYELKEYKKVLKYSSQIKKAAYIDKIIDLVVKSFIKLRNIQGLCDYCKNHTEYLSEYCKRKVIAQIEEYISTEPENCNNHIAQKISFIDPRYKVFVELRNDFYKNKNIDAEKIETVLYPRFEINQIYYSDLLYIKLKLKQDIVNYLCQYDKHEINEMLKYLDKKYSDFNIQIAQVNQIHILDINDIRILKVYNQMSRFLLINNYVEEKYEEVFLKYILNGVKYICKVYNLKMLINEYRFIEESEDRFFAMVVEAIINQKNNVNIDVEKIILQYPNMKKGIELIKPNIFVINEKICEVIGVLR